LCCAATRRAAATAAPSKGRSPSEEGQESRSLPFALTAGGYSASGEPAAFVSEIQPGSHDWPLQLAEAGLFVAIAAVLVALTVLAVRGWRT
jgi:hypothetical protein